ncbi:MAG: O-methyltransferase [Bacteroidota bacterium]
MNIVDAQAQAYCERYSTAEDDLLKEVVQYTAIHHPDTPMLSGHLQGKFLQAISTMLQPNKILEIGTFTGYSALCLAKGLAGTDAQLHTIEMREADATAAVKFFGRSIFKEKIISHVGNALDIIGELNETWDLVFIDADKVNYINYFNLVFSQLRPKGFILADNVLFHGEVLTQNPKGKNAKAIQAFNDFIDARTDIEKLMLPVRDGLYLLQKLH